MPGPIVLMTDFGESDPFVGVMKGVILSRHPEARVVDLTHHVPPQDVRLGAFYLMGAVPYFPHGTLFVCVVDPGVGSKRRILWARTDAHQFLAPDNGILSWVERVAPFREVREVSNRLLFLDRVSPTFHGRDVFAPVAGALSSGIVPSVVGPTAARAPKRIPFPEPRRLRGGRVGTVMAVDRFGNAITNLAVRDIPEGAEFRCRGHALGGLKPRYSAVPTGRALAVEGSFGFVELSVRGGSFALACRARVGTLVEALRPVRSSGRRSGR